MMNIVYILNTYIIKHSKSTQSGYYLIVLMHINIVTVYTFVFVIANLEQ